MHVAVIGAGAFGGWTALHLLRRGMKVTLLDAWGPGNSRASSGGETRVIRGGYGVNGIYTQMTARSLPLWKENQARWNVKLFHPAGVLWMAPRNDDWAKATLGHLREAGLPFQQLDRREIGRRWPQMNPEGLGSAILESDAGFLLARQACQAVLAGFVQEGGEYRQRSATPGAIREGAMQAAKLSDGSELAADQYVFACGPWLAKIFPEEIGERVTPTRQEVLFFGAPAGDPRFTEEQFPAWIDTGAQRFYGIPGNQWRGFKIADDEPGEVFDPTAGDRVPSEAAIRKAREYLAFRFPAMKNAPLVEARVCQYEMSTDGHFILDRHPRCGNAWLAGGGSGHGFKMGPAVGERLADLVLGLKQVDLFFALSRAGLAAKSARLRAIN